MVPFKRFTNLFPRLHLPSLSFVNATENSEFLDMEGETDSNYDSVNYSGRVSTVDSLDPDEEEDTRDAENPRRKRATA